jgi:dihydroorotate dehydrogenase
VGYTQDNVSAMLKPWLWLPPKWAHDLSPWGLKVLSFFYTQNNSLNWSEFQSTAPDKKIIQFKNPLGIAGGVDKNGQNILDWQNLNAGFIEVGTVTPLEQKPNPGKIIDRDLKTLSVWNKMGFPSAGKNKVKQQIKKIKSNLNIPLFINLGKNRTTLNEDAHQDYTILMNEFADEADAFVINISSPNTKGLRDLLQPESLNHFLSQIMFSYHQIPIEKNRRPLIFIKLSPDIENSIFQETILICIKHNIDGFILTNTTLDRTQTSFYSKEGGVSGLPLKDLSLKALRTTTLLCKQQNCKKMIISVGGVMTADDVFERIREGANLVQVYSALIFNGPLFFRKVALVAKKNLTDAKQTGTKRSIARQSD